MGSLISLQKLYKMKLLLLSFLVSVSLAEPEADSRYLGYGYGHHLGYSHLGYAGYAGYPYSYYGKRDAKADPQYLTYGHHLGYSQLGYAGYAGYPYSYYGKRDAEAEPQVLTYGVPAVHHYVPAVHHLSYAAVVVPGLVAHPNGAIVPLEPQEVVKARAEHLA